MWDISQHPTPRHENNIKQATLVKAGGIRTLVVGPSVTTA